MNIIMKLTLRHLKSNIKRTIVTIFGIVVSTALITAMLTGIYSAFMFVADVTVYVDGNHHANFKNISEEDYNNLKNDPRILYVGATDNDNEKTGFYIDGDSEKRFRIGNVYHADPDNLSQMVTCEYEGRLPENDGEIAIEEEFLKDNDLNLQVGDTLSFHQGYRYGYENNELTYYAGNYRTSEEFCTLSDEKCMITAILHRNEPTGSFDIIRGMEQFPENNLVYITLKKTDRNAVRTLRDIASAYNLSFNEMNTEYLMSLFVKDIPSNPVNSIYKMIVFAIVIIVIASSIMIYNAFAMSLTERMKYLGMLSGVGATGRQKKASVYYEGFILGSIGIPLGYLFGILGCMATLRFTGSLILSSGMLYGLNMSVMGHIPVKTHPVIILAILFFSVLTILISSFVPAVKASRITAIEAIRQTNVIRLRARNLKVLPFVKLLFGYEGELASKNIKRNGAKGVVITVSMAVSIVLLLSVTYLVDLFNKENSYEIEIPFQVFAAASLSERERLKEDISKLDGVEKIFVAEMISYNFNPKDADGNDREIPNTSIRNPEFLTKDYEHLFETTPDIWVIPVEDEDFIRICEENGVDHTKYFKDELRGVLLNNYTHKASRKDVFNDKILGQKLFYDKAEGNPPGIIITDFVKWDKKIEEYRLSPKGSISVYVPSSVMDREYVKNVDEKELISTYGIQCKNHEEVYAKVSDILTYDGYTNSYVSDVEDQLIIMKTLLTLVKTVMYGFIVLISLIVMANIVNTITTGVHLRRKEFAMFKSVGMTEFCFKKMLFLETFLYGLRALLFGLPISVLISFAIYKNVPAPASAFELNIFTYILVSLGVFAIVGISMLASTSTLKNDSIIEGLREELC
ncbi:MAG: ABC transporter permease [Lachnospiraceae bacterium]|nr:ABC transporter permease [Lachnospiraceae bacterium]